MTNGHRAVDEPGATSPRTAIIGAGIVGLCTALHLQRHGHHVTIYDAGGPAAGASYGNAGLLSPDSCIPIAMPGMLAKIPRWLFHADSPLKLDMRYLATAAPWLQRFLRAGTRPNALRTARGLRQINAPTFEIYRGLLGPEKFDDLIRRSGQIQVWTGDDSPLTKTLIQDIWRENGIEFQPLDRDELRQLEPELSTDIDGGLFFPNNGMTVNPARLVETLCGAFERAGGVLRRESVMKILPEGAGQYRLLANRSDARYQTVAVTAGAWSAQLLRHLGVKIPLETERGYHVTVRDPGIALRTPVLHRGLGAGATPMEDGIRLAGTVEIAGLSRPPDERRAALLVRHAKRLFPKLRTEQQSAWMGFRPSLPDSLPVIDAAAAHPGLFMGFGNGHFGMTAGPATGRALAALIAGRPPEIDLNPYRADRF